VIRQKTIHKKQILIILESKKTLNITSKTIKTIDNGVILILLLIQVA